MNANKNQNLVKLKQSSSYLYLTDSALGMIYELVVKSNFILNGVMLKYIENLWRKIFRIPPKFNWEGWLDINQFLEEVEYEYVITYSGLRYDEHNPPPEKRDPLEDPGNDMIFYQGNFHESAKKVKRFSHSSTFTESLSKIFSMKFRRKGHYFCAPIFRDAIVFYTKEGEINAVLQICFQCEFLINGDSVLVKADDNVYRKLRQLFIDTGHVVEE